MHLSDISTNKFWVKIHFKFPVNNNIFIELYTSANGIADQELMCSIHVHVINKTLWIKVSICYPSILISYYACTMTFLERFA